MVSQSIAILHTLAPPNNPRVNETHIIFIPSLERKWMRSKRTLGALWMAYTPASGWETRQHKAFLTPGPSGHSASQKNGQPSKINLAVLMKLKILFT